MPKHGGNFKIRVTDSQEGDPASKAHLRIYHPGSAMPQGAARLNVAPSINRFHHIPHAPFISKPPSFNALFIF